jgi:hypothetical protein
MAGFDSIMLLLVIQCPNGYRYHSAKHNKIRHCGEQQFEGNPKSKWVSTASAPDESVGVR